MNVEKHSTRSVARIGDVQSASGEIPEQPGINCSEGELAALSPPAGAVHMIEQPTQLASGKIGVDNQAGFTPDHIGVSRLFQLVTVGSRAAVLPDNGIMDRRAGFAVPDDGRLALIRD